MIRVFISYSSRDRIFTERLVADLKQAGIEASIDVEGIKGGEIWLNAVERMISEADFVFYIASPDSKASKWCEREILYADSRGKLIIPILIGGRLGIPPLLVNLQPYDMSEDYYKDSLQELVVNLEKYLVAHPRLSTSPQPYIDSYEAHDSTELKDDGFSEGQLDTSVSEEINQIPVQFTAFAPKSIEKHLPYSLIIYAHVPSAFEQVEQDVSDFKDKFGDDIPQEKQAHDKTGKDEFHIARGTEIEIIPECEGITFSPSQLKRTWDKDWIRYRFDFSISEDYVDSELWIRVSIQIKGFEIAHIKISYDLTKVTASNVHRESTPNPLEKAMRRGDLMKAITKPYRNVFISYAREDRRFALGQAKEIERALGDKVFIDVKSLRTGDDWEYQIAKAIKEADIFQLLWSEYSATSEYCKYEWNYALNNKCAENRCVGIVRPIFWRTESLYPPAPEELQHLNFKHVDYTSFSKRLLKWFSRITGEK